MSVATIHVIGCGGIGSYLIRELASLRDTNQLIGMDGTSYNICIYDDDEVEQKNLTYQNFEDDDDLESKAEVLGNRYNVQYQEMRVDSVRDIILGSDDVLICAVDSAEFRRSFYGEMNELPNFWLDLRCHGRFVMYYIRDDSNDMDYLLTTLPESTKDGEGSCQRQADLEAGIIQMGNRIVAPIGAQIVLNHLRSADQPARFIRQF